jgi:hypothetical protein
MRHVHQPSGGFQFPADAIERCRRAIPDVNGPVAISHAAVPKRGLYAAELTRTKFEVREIVTQDIFDEVCRSESLTELRDDHVEFRHNIWFRLNLQGRDEIFHGMFTQDFRKQFRVDDSTLWRFCCSHCGLSIDQYSPPEN